MWRLGSVDVRLGTVADHHSTRALTVADNHCINEECQESELIRASIVLQKSCGVVVAD